jgi:tetraacyldisaccharide 4'-kinase
VRSWRARPDDIWFGDSVGANVARAALTPVAWLYGGGVRFRSALYDAGLFRKRSAELPVLSVGNLTVGGTGKTPIAAWVAAQLADHGASPAIVLRGYGADEPLVHRALNPGVPVIVAPDRLFGVTLARQQGCDAVVLDDGFQHRRLGRDEDWVLVSADRPSTSRRLLPAGEWREPPEAIRRASLILVTRKAVSAAEARRVGDVVSALAPDVLCATAHIAAHDLRVVGGDDAGAMPLSAIAGRPVRALAAIGDPAAFLAQLQAFRPSSVTPVFQRDHYAWTAADVERLAVPGPHAQVTVCTLKDAVKLSGLWPRAAAPLWYVSQRVEIESGDRAISESVSRILSARRAHTAMVAVAGDPHS